MRYGLGEPAADQDGRASGFPAQSSVLDEIMLGRLVASQYQFPQPISCRFYVRGDSDVYRVTTVEARYYLKVHRPPHTLELAEAEAQYTIDLAQAGVNVVKPLRRTDGGFATVVEALEGVRPVLLFEEAPAGVIDAGCGLAGQELGAAVARLHAATDSLNADYQFRRFDIDSVVNGTLPYAEQYLSADDFQFLLKAAQRVKQKLNKESREQPDFGLCHADPVMSNLRYGADTGVTFFDFAGAAYTWRLLDIAVASRNMARKLELDSEDTLREVKAGYASVRALPRDFDRLLPAVLVLQWLSWIGGNAATLPLRLGVESMEGGIFTAVIQRIREACESEL